MLQKNHLSLLSIQLICIFNSHNTPLMDPLNKKPDTYLLRLKGPVKQLMETCYKAHQVAGIVVQGKIEVPYSFYRFNSITSFNDKGYKIKELLYDTDKSQENFYNDKN